MREADLNTSIQNILNRGGWAYKIPDPPQAVAKQSSKRPFDGLALSKGLTVAWESKLLKGGYQSFNYANKVEPHQWENLMRIHSEGGQAIIVLGIWEQRKFLDILVFDASCLERRMREEKSSLWKKPLERLKEAGHSINILGKREDDLTWTDVFGLVLTEKELLEVDA
jgi:penicillin-binding protein-related factor A (putative recombinase)